MKSQIAHSIKHRKQSNDDFETPELLVKKCIELVDLKLGDFVLDAFAGNKVFYKNYPNIVKKDWCEIKEEKDFYNYNKKVDWIITNPPYSILDPVLAHTYEICNKGFGYLLGIHNLTAKRIEEANQKGFYLTKIHICKIFKWFGMSVFVVFEKNKRNIVSYDRIVWR